MGKNVAVFVDVANIFYAAKAAGVDIDYVTLLKASSAGRDLVRAYAYTGLDPDNENQRNFHDFLRRHGYKVVSKDIRKYGDGKVKANLDIELVVDMMKTARNLDIAIVVSGDGDFAPAIRAVQEQGVRVEVVSFRGNTSSDLMDVADLFTDITQIAKVEKGSSRSGRRVADDEGDLSMTEVPEKQSEGTGERRSRAGPHASRSRRRRLAARGRERVAAAAHVASRPSWCCRARSCPERADRSAGAAEPARSPRWRGRHRAGGRRGAAAGAARGELREEAASPTARRGGRGRGRGRGRDEVAGDRLRRRTGRRVSRTPTRRTSRSRRVVRHPPSARSGIRRSASPRPPGADPSSDPVYRGRRGSRRAVRSRIPDRRASSARRRPRRSGRWRARPRRRVRRGAGPRAVRRRSREHRVALPGARTPRARGRRPRRRSRLRSWWRRSAAVPTGASTGATPLERRAVERGTAGDRGHASSADRPCSGAEA